MGWGEAGGSIGLELSAKYDLVPDEAFGDRLVKSDLVSLKAADVRVAGPVQSWGDALDATECASGR